MKTITLTAKEIRALEAQLFINPCSSGCVYEEMQNSKKDCDKCPFTKAIESICEKLGMND